MKFFRNIRKRFLTENKFSKYLIYAIGEVILVVIGILIAVELNNSNENRKHLESLNGMYAIVAEDLRNDIHEIDEMIERYDSLEDIFLNVLNGSMTKEDYDSCGGCERIIIGYPDLSIEKRGYDLLRTFQSTTFQGRDGLQVAIIQFYSKHLAEIEMDDNSRSLDLENNYMYWKNTHAWWSDHYLEKYSEEFIHYAVHDPDYKNRVATFYGDTYNVYLPELKSFKNEGNALIIAISDRIDSSN